MITEPFYRTLKNTGNSKFLKKEWWSHFTIKTDVVVVHVYNMVKHMITRLEKAIGHMEFLMDVKKYFKILSPFAYA